MANYHHPMAFSQATASNSQQQTQYQDQQQHGQQQYGHHQYGQESGQQQDEDFDFEVHPAYLRSLQQEEEDEVVDFEVHPAYLRSLQQEDLLDFARTSTSGGARDDSPAVDGQRDSTPSPGFRKPSGHKHSGKPRGVETNEDENEERAKKPWERVKEPWERMKHEPSRKPWERVKEGEHKPNVNEKETPLSKWEMLQKEMEGMAEEELNEDFAKTSKKKKKKKAAAPAQAPAPRGAAATAASTDWMRNCENTSMGQGSRQKGGRARNQNGMLRNIVKESQRKNRM